MKVLIWPFVFWIYAAISCFGLYLIKTATSIVSMHMMSGMMLWISGAIMWIMILRRLPLSFAFPIASGLLMLGTTLVGAIFLKEAVSPSRILGILTIIFGILLVTRSAGDL